MLSEISIRQALEWMEYADLEPFGEERADLRSAIIACTVANANRSKGPPFKPGDFMPKFDAEPVKQSPDQMAAVFAAFAEAHNNANRI